MNMYTFLGIDPPPAKKKKCDNDTKESNKMIQMTDGDDTKDCAGDDSNDCDGDDGLDYSSDISDLEF